MRPSLLRRLIGRLLAGVGVLVIVVECTPLVPWWARALAGPWTDGTGDTLIVLGGSASPDELTIGESSYWRSVYAIRAYQQEHFRQVVIAGGGESPLAIAESMAEFFECHGVPSTAIIVERQSSNTRENAMYVAKLLTGLPGTRVLMTSDYHMLRAHRAFEKAGVNVVPRPIPDAIKRGGSFQHRFGAFVELCRETAAIGYYYSRGWI